MLEPRKALRMATSKVPDLAQDLVEHLELMMGPVIASTMVTLKIPNLALMKEHCLESMKAWTKDKLMAQHLDPMMASYWDQ